MLKKFNVFALALLIIGQTILGPMAVSAETITPGSEAQTASEEEANVSETTETKPEEKTEPENESNGENSETVTKPEIGQGDGDVEKKDDTTDSKTEDKPTEGKEESEKKSEDKQEETPADSEEGDVAESDVTTADEEEDGKVSTSATGNPVDAKDITITNLEIGRKDGTSSTGPNNFPLEITTENFSDTYYVKFNFSLRKDHDVQSGDFYKFKVPAAFALTEKTEPIEDFASYSVQPDGWITITFNGEVRNANNEGIAIDNGGFDAGWGLAQVAKEGKLVKVFDFELAGDKTFTLTVANPGGVPLAKSSLGSLPVGKNPTHVKWQVDVNTNTKDISSLELKDSLTVDPDSIIEVIELEPQINGTVVPRQDVTATGYTLSGGNNFPITFDNSKKAYRITYQTEITDKQREEAIKNNTEITNKASLGDAESTANQRVIFDKPITKSAVDYSQSAGASGEIKWTINVNADGRDISTGVTVKDELTMTGTSADNQIMKIEGTPVIEPQPASTSFTEKADGTFTVTFVPEDANKYKEHTITYSTKDEVVDLDYGVINKAELWYGTDTTVASAYETDPVSKDVKHNMLTKLDIDATSSKINYEDKTIDWTINFNSSGYNGITDVVFEDTFEPGKYMKLYKTDFENIPAGFELTLTDADTTTEPGKEFTLKGFTLKADSTTIVDAPVTITYKTYFDPKNPTTGTSISNAVDVDWKIGSVGYENKDKGTVTLNSHTGNNGAKSGQYNPEHKTIDWTLDVNYNLHDLTNPVIEDTFGKKQTMTAEQLNNIEVYTLNMLSTPTIKDTLLSPMDYSVVGTGETDDGFTGFTLTFNKNTTSEAYRVVYKTGYVNKFIGELDGTNSESAKNAAVLKSNGTEHTTYDTDKLDGSPNIPNAGEYFTKNGRDIPNVDYLEWKFAFNNSQSYIQKGSTIEDILNEGQVLVEDFTGLTLADITTPRDAFEIKKRVYTGTSHTQQTLTAAEVDALFDIDIEPDKKSFTITLKQDINHEYEISYVTDISASSLKTLSNTYTYNFNGKVKEETSTVEVHNVTYEYSGGTGNLRMYNLKLTKTDGNTNDALEKVKFGLYLGSTPVMEAETDSNGELNFKNIKYGTYTLKELSPSDPSYSTEFQVDGESIFSDEYKYKTEGTDPDLEIKMINKKICPIFTLTVKYDGNPVQAGVNVVIKDKTGTTEVATGKTNADGKIKFDKDDLPKGEYKVYDTKGNELGDITVLYLQDLQGDCVAEVRWAPTANVSCPTFTLTVKENGTPVGENMKITLQDSTDDTKAPVTAYTDADGKIKYLKVDLPVGKYDVFNNKNEKIGTVEVESIIVCEDEIDLTTGIIQACPTFTLTVNDRSNNPREDVTVKVKDASGKEVEGVDENGDPTKTFKTDENGKVIFPYVIEKGTYKAYEVDDNGDEKLIGSFTVKDTCSAIVKPSSGDGGWNPPPTESCENFVVTVKDASGKPRANVEVTLKNEAGNVYTHTTNADGEISLPYATTISSQYTVYEGTTVLGSITVDYTGDCKDEVIVPAPNACTDFTITVKESGKVVEAGTSLTLKDASGKTVATGTTDANGKIVFAKDKLAEGTYTAYDKDDKAVGTIVVSYDQDKCQDEIDLLVKSCEAFTITVKESGKVVEAGTSITLKDSTGKTVITGTTDANGKIVFAKDKLPTGSYTAYDKDGKAVGTIVVSYDQDKCQDEIDLLPKACDSYTLTVVDTPNKVIDIKDENGKTVATGTTDANGKVIFTKPIPEGSYEVYVDGKKVADLSVKDSCEGVVTPDKNDPGTNPPDGGDGNETTPPNPGKPGDGDGNVAPPGGNGGDNGNVTPPGGTGNNNGGGNVSPPGNSGKNPDTGKNNISKLPQTGEEQFMYMIALGTLFLAAGAVVLYRQRRRA